MSYPDPWPAPRAVAPVKAALGLPGSKSVTNRALVLAALADAPSRAIRPLRSRDTLLMAAGLRAMGAEITDDGEDWQIIPRSLSGPATIDVGNAGTVMRFLPPVAALATGPIAFHGDPRSYQRPLGPVITALRSLGAEIEDGNKGALPLTVHGAGGLKGGVVDIDASASSQFVSALLLIAPRTERGITIRHTGSSLPSMPHIEMTIEMLGHVGAHVDTSEPNVWNVEPQPLRGRDAVVEPDLSNAAPFLAGAIVTGGSVVIRDWPSSTTQAGDSLRSVLADMGAEVRMTEDGLEVRAGRRLIGLDRDLHDVGELTPVIAALCALASTPSRLSGIAHLRLHETDRLAALANEINRLGGNAVETEDGLVISPQPLHGGVFHSYDDHRIATAGALLGLVVSGVFVENIATTHKTLPNFPALWEQMLSDGSA
jgi:3-phosphoshikimate 1-carboxyvinyltransferase